MKGGQITVFQRRTVLKRHSQIFLATTRFSGDFFRFRFFFLAERKEGRRVGNKVTGQKKKKGNPAGRTSTRAVYLLECRYSSRASSGGGGWMLA